MVFRFHLPIAYHGRASSIVISGTDIIRPRLELISTVCFLVLIAKSTNNAEYGGSMFEKLFLPVVK